MALISFPSMVILCGTCLGQVGGQKPSIPPSLVRALEYRERISSIQAQYEYTVQFKNNPLPCLQRREDIAVGTDILTVNRGDADGILFREEGYKPLFGVGLACAPQKELKSQTTGDYWNYFEGDVHASVQDCGRNVHLINDARSIGLGRSMVGMPPEKRLAQIRAAGSNFEWNGQTTSDGLIRVTAISTERAERERKHKREFRVRNEWTIDPAKGDAILRWATYRISKDGREELMSEVETEYEVQDGYWFPKFSKARTPILIESIRVQSVTINRPEHPKKLTPDLLGMPAGVMVHSPKRWGTTPGPVSTKRWDGKQLRDWNDWEQTKDAYDHSEFDRLEKLMATRGQPGAYPAWWYDDTGMMGLEGLPYRPGLWEDYVRRWLMKREHKAKHPIGSKQRTAAASILKDCQDRAFPIFQRVEKELTQIEGELAKKSIDAKARAAAECKRSGLTSPITELFEKSLKPRLEALLDSDQVREATTQPESKTIKSRK